MMKLRIVTASAMNSSRSWVTNTFQPVVSTVAYPLILATPLKAYSSTSSLPDNAFAANSCMPSSLFMLSSSTNSFFGWAITRPVLSVM
ncbi:MAG: hypothetical protein A4E73_02895 [Syntrophaceae bacterium PtaU1.Bin231]|nr:MAG: hypothetical protein A4E73_02895 [Syntrophaceae bacterium PtaU1.Bin231]